MKTFIWSANVDWSDGSAKAEVYPVRLAFVERTGLKSNLAFFLLLKSIYTLFWEFTKLKWFEVGLSVGVLSYPVWTLSMREGDPVAWEARSEFIFSKANFFFSDCCYKFLIEYLDSIGDCLDLTIGTASGIARHLPTHKGGYYRIASFYVRLKLMLFYGK